MQLTLTSEGIGSPAGSSPTRVWRPPVTTRSTSWRRRSRAQFPGTRFRRSTGIDAHHGHARYGWELVGADGSVVLTGMDVAHVGDDGRLAAVVGFFGGLPAT